MEPTFEDAEEFRNTIANFTKDEYSRNATLREAVEASGQGLDGFVNDLRKLKDFTSQASDLAITIIGLFFNAKVNVVNNETDQLTAATHGSGERTDTLVRFTLPSYHYWATKPRSSRQDA